MFQKITELSKINILINNAATYKWDNSLLDVDANDLINAYQVNAVTPFLLSQLVFKQMQNENWGRIVNVSSIGVKYGGSTNSPSYGMSKAALEVATTTFAKVGAQHNILINAIRPGMTNTDFHQKASGKDISKRVNLIPLKRMALPEEIAKSIYLLGSEENTYITGTVTAIAGGE
jgi:NAD(P)-dependent dehydrogenase (short-subunit alcohol dehydrogenase family)